MSFRSQQQRQVNRGGKGAKNRRIADPSEKNFTEMYSHLLRIKAILQDGTLTTLGNVARFFPQPGGLLVAQMIDQGVIHSDNLRQVSQLLAALSVARYKKIEAPVEYEFPYKIKSIEKDLEWFYPYDLFSDEYDPPWGKRRFPVIRDFNLNAGYIVHEWSSGVSWDELMGLVGSEFLGAGDVSGVIFEWPPTYNLWWVWRTILTLLNRRTCSARSYFENRFRGHFRPGIFNPQATKKSFVIVG